MRTPTAILCKSVSFRASSLVHQYAVPTATWSGLLEIEEELRSCWLSKHYTMQAGKKKPPKNPPQDIKRYIFKKIFKNYDKAINQTEYSVEQCQRSGSINWPSDQPAFKVNECFTAAVRGLLKGDRTQMFDPPVVSAHLSREFFRFQPPSGPSRCGRLYLHAPGIHENFCF